MFKIQEDEVWVLAIRHRKSVYRPETLKTTLERARQLARDTE